MVTLREHMEACHGMERTHPEVDYAFLQGVHRNDHELELAGVKLQHPHGHFVFFTDEPEPDPVATAEEEYSQDAAQRFARRNLAVQELHAERRRVVEGATLKWCRECQQNWPCPTVLVAQGAGE